MAAESISSPITPSRRSHTSNHTRIHVSMVLIDSPVDRHPSVIISDRSAKVEFSPLPSPPSSLSIVVSCRFVISIITSSRCTHSDFRFGISVINLVCLDVRSVFVMTAICFSYFSHSILIRMASYCASSLLSLVRYHPN